MVDDLTQNHKMFNVNLLYFLIMYIVCVILCDRCCDISYHSLPEYNLIKNKTRSNQPIISRTVVSNITDCKRFAAFKKALAFNFISGKDPDGKVENTCQALQCAEDDNMTTVVSAANHKYYSMYSNFTLPEALNYTAATSFCRKQNASLVHVISEERTSGLAKLLSPDIPHFVGLSRNGREKIWKNEFGESLSCFNYRAWGDGEPSHSRGCVVLINPSDKSLPPFWKVVPCYIPLPFICEISPLPSRSSQKSPEHQENRE